MNEQNMVREFHDAFGLYSADTPTMPEREVRALRLSLIEEELGELSEAFGLGDLVATADALGDLLYVVYGAAVACGIDLDPVFAEIHRTNMAKVGGARRGDGKLMKPEGWQPPDLAAILAGQSPMNDFVAGSIVRLRAGGEAMLVEEVSQAVPGFGLLCSWVEEGKAKEAWISASSVVRVPHA